MLYVITALAIASTAHAGKLAQGILDQPWGPRDAFDRPWVGCTHRPEPAIEWSCPTTLGDVPIRISYAWEFGHVYGAIIQAEGGYAKCGALMDVLEAAWGPSTPASKYLREKLDERLWGDGDKATGETIARWKYNQFSGKCSVVVLYGPSNAAVIETKKAAAAKAASAL